MMDAQMEEQLKRIKRSRSGILGELKLLEMKSGLFDWYRSRREPELLFWKLATSCKRVTTTHLPRHHN